MVDVVLLQKFYEAILIAGAVEDVLITLALFWLIRARRLGGNEGFHR